jgi:hypothetical protein
MKVTFYAHADPGKVAGVVKALKESSKWLPGYPPGRSHRFTGISCLLCGKFGCHLDSCAVLSPLVARMEADHLVRVEKGLPLPGTIEFEELA